MQELLLKDEGWILENPEIKELKCSICREILKTPAVNFFYCRENKRYFCLGCEKKNVCRPANKGHEHFNIIGVKREA